MIFLQHIIDLGCYRGGRVGDILLWFKRGHMTECAIFPCGRMQVQYEIHQTHQNHGEERQQISKLPSHIHTGNMHFVGMAAMPYLHLRPPIMAVIDVNSTGTNVHFFPTTVEVSQGDVWA